MKLIDYYSDSAEITIYIAIIIGAFKFKYLSKEIRIIYYFVLLGGATELFTDLYKAYIARNTGPIGHFYMVSSILIIGLFYRKALAGYIKNIIIDVSIVLFLLGAIINLIFIQDLNDFPNIIGSIGALMLVIFAILLFARIMTEAKIINLWKNPLVLINIAILFYYAGNFFYFILFNLDVEFSNDFALQVLKYYCVLNGAFYIFAAVIFYKSKQFEKISLE